LIKLGFSLTPALVVATILIVAENAATLAYFPHLDRLTTDFSIAYFKRELRMLAAEPPQIVFIGDSVLWGYRLHPEQTAVALLRRQGCACVNLAFKSGNPPNDYFVSQLLLGWGIRPRLVVLDVNQAVLNESDAYYQSLHPTVASLSAPLLTAADRASLSVPSAGNALERRIDRLLSSLFTVYAMRSDIRETVSGDTEAAPMPRLTPELFEGTYDLVPLTESNVGVRYLEKTVELWHRSGIPVVAFLTPVNHQLLHQYIDNAHYLRNVQFLKRNLAARGADVIDLDNAFPGQDFLDNAHLTLWGQRRLAAALAQRIPALRERTHN